jgi:leader peptidase (prepilin peptidase)/N-methyltransferase
MIPYDGSSEALILLFVCACFLGLCLGSFSTALIYRIPRGISWIRDGKGMSRSKCPSCQTQLEFPDLIPFFSWLLSRGKCRYCKAGISASYPLTELSCLILVAALTYIWGAQWATLPLLLMVPFFVAHIVIDWEHMILPDEINFVLITLSLVFLALGGAGDAWVWNLAAGIILPFFFWVVSILMRAWKKKEALGMGDLKFVPVAGLLLGLGALPSFLIVGGVLGLATGLYYQFSGRKGAFPFGPALIISTLFHLFLTGYGFEYTR